MTARSCIPSRARLPLELVGLGVGDELRLEIPFELELLKLLELLELLELLVLL